VEFYPIILGSNLSKKGVQFEFDHDKQVCGRLVQMGNLEKFREITAEK
jgi:hypothetical protein